MKKLLFITAMCLMIFLVACGSKTTGKRVAIPETSDAPAVTAAAVADVATTPEKTPDKSAAETLKELQTSPVSTSTSPKTGTFYPPVTATGTGKEVLAAKTHALMANSTYDPNVKADSQFGPKYHSSSGGSKNLPTGYTDS